MDPSGPGGGRAAGSNPSARLSAARRDFTWAPGEVGEGIMHDPDYARWLDGRTAVVWWSFCGGGSALGPLTPGFLPPDRSSDRAREVANAPPGTRNPRDLRANLCARARENTRRRRPEVGLWPHRVAYPCTSARYPRRGAARPGKGRQGRQPPSPCQDSTARSSPLPVARPGKTWQRVANPGKTWQIQAVAWGLQSLFSPRDDSRRPPGTSPGATSPAWPAGA